MTLNVYASLFDDDLDLVSERLDVAISQAAVSYTCLGPRRPWCWHGLQEAVRPRDQV